MSIIEIVLSLLSSGGLLTAIAAVVYNRKQPELNQAQAVNELVNSEAVKVEIQKDVFALNVNRDLRIIDLENWADKMRPWVWEVKDTFGTMCRLMKEDRAALGLPMPELALSEPPDFPRPTVLG